MKKIISIVAALTAATVLLVGCGSSNSTSESGNSNAVTESEGTNSPAETESANDARTQDEINTANAYSVELGNTYTTNNDIEFSLFKVVTSSKLQAVSGSGSYFEADSGYNYALTIYLTVGGFQHGLFT